MKEFRIIYCPKQSQTFGSDKHMKQDSQRSTVVRPPTASELCSDDILLLAVGQKTFLCKKKKGKMKDQRLPLEICFIKEHAIRKYNLHSLNGFLFFTEGKYEAFDKFLYTNFINLEIQKQRNKQNLRKNLKISKTPTSIPKLIYKSLAE